MHISDLKRNRLLMMQLRWDMKPADLFTTRFVGVEADRKILKETNGIIFYVEAYRGMKPVLMLLRTIDLMTSTIGDVEGAPEELLKESVEKGKGISDMYPISPELEAWLKKELGLE